MCFLVTSFLFVCFVVCLFVACGVCVCVCACFFALTVVCGRFDVVLLCSDSGTLAIFKIC